MGRIAKILEKCKRGVGILFEACGKEDIFLILLIALVGFGGFGLGRLSKISEERTPVRIYKESLSSGASGDVGSGGSAIMPESKQFVASVSGAKYHLPWCAGASTIKEENKIWFATEEEAQKAGYTAALNCPGL